MEIKLKQKIWRLVKTLSIIYILGGIALYFIQDLLLFHPVALPQTHKFSFQQPYREINLPVQNRNLNIVQFTVDSISRKGIVLYFHGNRRNVERYAQFASAFTKNGYEVWMMDYPGFGKSTGKLTEASMYSDAFLLYQIAVKEVGGDDLVIYGKSLGTGVASHLASTNKCKQLILETPYYSLPSVAKAKFPIYPANYLIKYSFPTYEFLKKVTAPITIFHGTSDEIIPFKQAEKLKKENPQIKLVPIQGGKHNNLAQQKKFQTILDSLLRF
jgi:alpha-beta hydrolase superfamily lysophospholipase